MSYDPADDMPETVEMHPAFEPASELEAKYGPGMVQAVSDVIVNIFGERWEDDDEQAAFKALCEAYTVRGYPVAAISTYANSDAAGLYFEALDGITWQAVIDADLIEP